MCIYSRTAAGGRMFRVTVLMLPAIFVQLLLYRSVVSGVKEPCQYSPWNVSLAYKDCFSAIHQTDLTKIFKHDVFYRLEADMKDAFILYCVHSVEINDCVLNRLMSQTCGKSISEFYMSMVSRSNAFCSDTAGLKEDVIHFFTVSQPIVQETIDRCRPSEFDLILCRRLADSSNNMQIRDATVERYDPETEYLLELSLCIYSSVFVGCPTDTAFLTMLYEIDEWLPPRLGANTTKVLNILNNRNSIFY